MAAGTHLLFHDANGGSDPTSILLGNSPTFATISLTDILENPQSNLMPGNIASMQGWY